MTLDANQILALAPDPASAKAGSQLATPRNWSNLGTSDSALWGECQGSGKTPYRTQIDLGGPAFKCTCPSRKFPCKHGLGLYLLRAAEPFLFDQAETPAWVSDWLQGRQSRQEKKTLTKDAGPEAAALARKREEKREDKVTAGLADLQTWLHDLAREGLASVRSRGQGFWDAIAARMADAQAAPVARRLRRAGSMLYQSGLRNAESLVANELASLYLLVRAWQRIDELAPALQADVRALLGWTMSQDDVLRQGAVTDRWSVLAQCTFDDERLRVRSTWLLGAATGRWALHLQYAVGTQGFEQQLAPGTTFDGDLCFYPSAWPLRAQIRHQDDVQPLSAIAGPSSLDTLQDTYADALAAQPFLERHPVLLGGLVPDGTDHGIVRNAQGRRIALHPSFRHPVHLLAVSGGHPLTVCAEWDGRMLLPLAVWRDGRLYNIDSNLP
ncbi:SWIM zinc finger family protein [Massilia sp. CT11-108]|uniref:SWIM zinc finger family protein n=1 Tax=Massilia sp. CT11-108 TaxID=3393900 RepID=UPI0039A7070B